MRIGDAVAAYYNHRSAAPRFGTAPSAVDAIAARS
jgi:hypothetical protein